SLAFTPSRARSLWYVNIPAKSVTPIAADAFLEPSAALVAVTLTTPAVVPATNVAEVAVTFLKVPHAAPLQEAPEALQVTPAAPTSLVTVAVKFRFCERVTPPRFGVIVRLTDPPPLLPVSVIVTE